MRRWANNPVKKDPVVHLLPAVHALAKEHCKALGVPMKGFIEGLIQDAVKRELPETPEVSGSTAEPWAARPFWEQR